MRLLSSLWGAQAEIPPELDADLRNNPVPEDEVCNLAGVRVGGFRYGVRAGRCGDADLERTFEPARQIDGPFMPPGEGGMAVERLGPDRAVQEFAGHSFDIHRCEPRSLAVVHGNPETAEALEHTGTRFSSGRRDGRFRRCHCAELHLGAATPRRRAPLHDQDPYC